MNVLFSVPIPVIPILQHRQNPVTVLFPGLGGHGLGDFPDLLQGIGGRLGFAVGVGDGVIR